MKLLRKLINLLKTSYLIISCRNAKYLFFSRFAGGRAGRAKKLAELFPVGRRDTGAVTGDNAPAVRNVIQEPLTQLGVPNTSTWCPCVIVGAEHCVVPLQTICLQVTMARGRLL